MRLVTGTATRTGTSQAVGEAYAQIRNALGTDPTLVVCANSVGYDTAEVAAAFRRAAPGVRLHGFTSCLGVMSNSGFHTEDGRGLGMIGILDPGGAYGVGIVPLAGSGRKAGADAVERALRDAERDGEIPATVWVSSAPGSEEDVLEGIADVLGPDVPVVGGSSADNTVSGRWGQYTQHEVERDGVVVGTMFPSTRTLVTFHSGYDPTERVGRVTAVSGRTLLEIDGKPAADVYDEWTDGLLRSSPPAADGNVLALTALWPLGRRVGRVLDVPRYQLSHPERVTPERGLSLFTNAAVGEQVVQMHGSRASLRERAARVAQAAMRAEGLDRDQIAGGLIVYCAGCMLTIQDEMAAVAAGLDDVFGGRPFLGTFTFGEQGCFATGENRHGNLMISVLLFAE